MATGVYIPIWGLQMEEATLSSWLIEEGRSVKKGQGVALIETYKISGEVESPIDGVLRRQVGQVGRVLKVGELVAVVGSVDEDEAEIQRVVDEEPLVEGISVTAPKTAPRETVQTPAPEASAPASVTPATTAAPIQTPVAPVPVRAVSTGPVRATPLARKLARERGLDLAVLQGSGPDGRIKAKDVTSAQAGPSISASRPAMAPVQPAQDRVIPLSPLRRAIINKTMQTVNIPYGALSRQVRLDRLLEFKNSLAGPFEARYGLKLAMTHLFFKAAALALDEAPELNSTLAGEEIICHGSRNIGMVVTPPGGGGIMIPVVRDVQAKSLAAIAFDWAALMERVQAGTQTLEDLSGGTFTISNVGPMGIDVFTPVIHPPESAILGLSRAVRQPVVEGEELVVGQVLSLIVGADHRVFDAEPIGRFLACLDRLFQNPAELLI